MAHRALQILQAIQGLLVANQSWSDDVHIQRVYSLDEDAELPAVIVSPGDDTGLSDLGNTSIAFIDSLLAVSLVAIESAATEAALIETLLEKRRQIHLALAADLTLGLDFVIHTRYQGAARPEIDAQGQRLIGMYEARWAVHYRMNLTDPS